ncbi:hypothetical protein M707_09655 [Arthrobacter sp. AK-YN10]|nr:hypothetical protein M707_09655 [Arthrobacter sp. AK-YN10]
MWFANLAYIAKDAPILMGEAARRLAVESMLATVPTRSNLILRGAVEYRRRNHQLAKHFISRAHSQLIPDSVISPFFAYSRSTCLFEEPYRGGLIAQSTCNDDKPWLLVAADRKYITKFLPNYVETMIQTGSSNVAGLHVRVVESDDTSDLDAAVQAVLSAASDALGTGFESSATTAPTVRDTRSWFASERFLHAKSMLADKGHLIITDIDYGLRYNASNFIEWSAEFDVCALLARPDEFKSYFPWLKVQAGTVSVLNSSAGHFFLDSFANNFKTSFVGSGWNWGVDQNALSTALDNMEGRAAIGNINDIRQPFYIPRALKAG